MKQFSKLFSVVIAICLVLQGFPALAGSEADAGEYLYYNSFDKNMDGLTLDPGYTSGDVSLATTEDGASALRFLRTLNSGETDASWGGDRFYLSAPVKPKEGFPKLVFEFRYRVNTTLGYMYGRMQDKSPMYNPNSPTVAIYDNEVWSDINKTTKIGNAPIKEWHTVTIIYDNESANRIIRVDNQPPVTVAGNNYYSQKQFQFHWASYARGNAEVDYDYLKIFEVPETFTAQVVNERAAEMDSIALELNTPLDLAAATADKFQLDGNTVTGITPDPANNLRCTLELAAPLAPETDYTLHVDNVENIYGVSFTGDVSFRTRSLMQYAKDIDVTASSAEQITVTSTFVNEKEVFNPVLAAAFYRADGSMRSFETQTNAVGLITEDNSETSAFTNQFAVPPDAEQTDVLELYYLRGENVWEPVSGKSIYTVDGKQESGFSPVVPPYDGTCIVTVTPNPETEEITLLADTGEADIQREVHFAVYTVPEPEDTEALVYAALEKTEAGTAAATFKMADANGQYRVSAYIRGAAQAEEDKSFTFFSKTILDGELAKVNQTADPNDVGAFINGYGEACNLDMEGFVKLSDAGKQQTYKALLALRDERTDKVFASTAELNEDLQTAVLMGRILDGDEVGTLLTENKDVLELDKTAAELYAGTISKGAAKAVAENLSGKEFLLPAEVAEAYTQRVVLDGIAKAESYIQTRPILEKMKDTIGLNFAAYNTLKNPEKISMALSGKTYNDYTALKSGFDAAVDRQKKTEDDSGKGNSGNGGGGYRPPQISFEQTPEPTSTAKPEKQFNDMEGYEWAQTAVLALEKKGIVAGKTEDTFAPADQVTRAEFLKLIVGAFRLPGKDGENPFADIGRNDWYYDYILNGYQNGIVSGLEADRFGPEEQVTREMAATMIYRAFQAIDATLVNEKNDFTDRADINDYAKEAVSRLCGHNILRGFEDQTFRPSAVCSRAEAAQMIYAAMGLFE